MDISFNIKLVLILAFLFCVSYESKAVDTSNYEGICLDIGFKKKTEAYADCVMELISREKLSQSSSNVSKQKAPKKDAEKNALKNYSSKSQSTRSSVKSIKSDGDKNSRSLTTRSSETGRKTAEYERQEKILNVLHPDWQQLVSSDDFAKWQKSLPIEEQETLINSWDAFEISRFFQKYKNSKANNLASSALNSTRTNEKKTVTALQALRSSTNLYDGVSDEGMLRHIQESYYPDKSFEEVGKMFGYISADKDRSNLVSKSNDESEKNNFNLWMLIVFLIIGIAEIGLICGSYFSIGSELGFFKKLGNGNFGLAKTFWLYNFLVNVVFSVITRLLLSYNNYSFYFFWLFIIFIPSLAYVIVVGMGVWSSAKNYLGPKIWAVLAKISVIFGVILGVILWPMALLSAIGLALKF